MFFESIQVNVHTDIEFCNKLVEAGNREISQPVVHVSMRTGIECKSTHVDTRLSYTR